MDVAAAGDGRRRRAGRRHRVARLRCDGVPRGRGARRSAAVRGAACLRAVHLRGQAVHGRGRHDGAVRRARAGARPDSCAVSLRLVHPRGFRGCGPVLVAVRGRRLVAGRDGVLRSIRRPTCRATPAVLGCPLAAVWLAVFWTYTGPVSRGAGLRTYWRHSYLVLDASLPQQVWTVLWGWSDACWAAFLLCREPRSAPPSSPASPGGLSWTHERVPPRCSPWPSLCVSVPSATGPSSSG